MRAEMLSYRMNSSFGAGNRRNYAYILNTTRDFSSHNPEQSNSEFYLQFLTLASNMARWNISSIGKATDPTNAPGNLRSPFPTLQKQSLSSIYIPRTVQLPRTYAPAL